MLDTIHKISAGRIIAGIHVDSSGDALILKIPVGGISPSDKKDVSARRYIKSWIRENLPAMKGKKITTKSLPVSPREFSWTLPDGERVPLHALIVITILEDREGEIDKWKRSNKRKKDRARAEFYETVKSSDS